MILSQIDYKAIIPPQARWVWVWLSLASELDWMDEVDNYSKLIEPLFRQNYTFTGRWPAGF